ncbi:MAG: sulfatase [Paracoccaceae bacterium]
MPGPNVILIFTDNQQAATLGCYGNSEVHTPNIDRLSAEGILFEKAFCANAFCSACRASALTGLLPSQHGVHSWIDDRNMQDWPAGWHALAGLATLPEEMKRLGYQTGIFGKYHLGDPRDPGPGWDSWVTMADGHVRTFYDNEICDNGAIYEEPGHAVDFFTDKALDFIGTTDGPYFAYIPYPAPYGHWPATKDGRRNRYEALYDNCPMHSVPREGLSAAAVRNYDMVKGGSGKGLDFSLLMRAPNDLPTLRNYYSQITMIDDAVGRLAEAAPDALIIFTTDHGLSLGHHGFWGHGGSTYPSNLHLAAHSIPMICRHPDHIAAGEHSPVLVSNVDLYATILDYVGGAPDAALPSRSFAGFLKGEAVANWGEDEVFSEQEETRVIRTPQWAFFKRFHRQDAPELQDELFNVVTDPGETTNLAGDPGHAHVVAELSARIEAFFNQHSRASADMWSGGRPIQNSMMRTYWQDIWGPDWQPVYAYDDD